MSLKSKWQTMHKWTIKRYYVTIAKYAHICRGQRYQYPFPFLKLLWASEQLVKEGVFVFGLVFYVSKNQAKLDGEVAQKTLKQFWIITPWPKIEPAFLGPCDYNGDSDCSGN